ncbi:MAG: glycosyltransferase family 4 protein [Burkholderiales bacterium]
MRILHLDPDDLDNPLAGGGPVRTFEICRRLARRHEITVLTPTFAGSTPEKMRDGVRYLRVGRKVGNHGSSHHITYLLSLPWAVRRHAHDLLVEDFMPPFSATLMPLLRPRGAALVASVQWFQAHDYTRWLKLPFHWGEDYGVRLYSDFVLLSESMKRRIESRHPAARCRVVPNGVDDSLFQLSARVGRGILFLGRLEIETKGIDLLLEAYARIPEHQREPLTLAGTVQEPEPLQRLLAQHGLEGWVRLHGRYDAAQRAALLEACRFVVMPSRTETFGMTLAEANAAAKPVVLWDVEPMNEVASSASLRVPAFDVAAYAQAMQSLLAAGDDELRMRGLQSRVHARRYDWDSAAEAQERVYLEAVEMQQRRKREVRHVAG